MFVSPAAISFEPSHPESRVDLRDDRFALGKFPPVERQVITCSVFLVSARITASPFLNSQQDYTTTGVLRKAPQSVRSRREGLRVASESAYSGWDAGDGFAEAVRGT